MPKIVLVTGAAGFIGYHTALALSKRNDLVIGLDNFNDYYSPQLKKDRASHLKSLGIDVVCGDLCNRELLESLFQKHGFSHVLNLAAQAGVRYARTHPESYLKSNLEGFLVLLEVLKKFPQTHLIYASSSSVYGSNKKIPFVESDMTDWPVNLYAATKKANELMAYSYHNLYKIPMVGLRYFTVYGPWGRPDMAYYSFSESILKNEPIYLFSAGKMKRDFTYIDDIVKGTIKALDLNTSWEIFNLGNHQPIEVLSLVKLLEKKIGISANIILKAESPGEVETTFADIDAAKSKLDYTPSISLEEGLSYFLEWLMQYRAKAPLFECSLIV